VQYTIQNVQDYLAASSGGQKLKTKASESFNLDYLPDLDVTPELTPVMDNFYQMQIWVLRFCVELGHIDIMTEVSLLSSHLCLSREGHLNAVHHLFTYLALKHNTRVVVEPTYPEIDESAFINTDSKAMYGDVKEADPIDAPTTLNNEVDLRL
jgi:hypothetical protein